MGSGAAPANTPGPDRCFSRLPPQDRAALCTWLVAMRVAGIERIEDLGSRIWPAPRAEFILGVFRTSQPLASWLLVGDGGAWVVASCTDGAVSARHASLAAALATLQPGGSVSPC
jgi:hypothetical protein